MLKFEFSKFKIQIFLKITVSLFVANRFETPLEILSGLENTINMLIKSRFGTLKCLKIALTPFARVRETGTLRLHFS